MNYHAIKTDDMLNGDGLRVTLFVSGCEHNCFGCHNPETWAVNSGIPFDCAAEAHLWIELCQDYINGVTFTGGDPLHPDNREVIQRISEAVQESFLDKNVWIYTGYHWEEIKNLSLLHSVDVLVDGPFVEGLADVSLPWVGSSNQRVIDVQKSLKQNQIVLWNSEVCNESI